MKKPLSISSPTHSIALSVYFILGFSGFMGVFNLNQQSLIIQAMGDGISDIWATTLMLGGWGAFASAIASKRAKRPEPNMWFEKLCCIAIFLNLTFYDYIVLTQFGPRGYSSAVFASAFAIGAGARAVQLFLERRLIKKARAHPETADPVMADPRDESDR